MTGTAMTDTSGAKLTVSEPITVYVSIGNSDDKLPQARWHEFWVAFRYAIVNRASQVHGEWLSIGCAPYQNGCICFEITADRVEGLKLRLSLLAAEYGQDSIAWAPAVTEFIGAPS